MWVDELRQTSNFDIKRPSKIFKKPEKPTYNALKKCMSREGESFFTFLMKRAYYLVD